VLTGTTTRHKNTDIVGDIDEAPGAYKGAQACQVSTVKGTSTYQAIFIPLIKGMSSRRRQWP